MHLLTASALILRAHEVGVSQVRLGTPGAIVSRWVLRILLSIEGLGSMQDFRDISIAAPGKWTDAPFLVRQRMAVRKNSKAMQAQADRRQAGSRSRSHVDAMMFRVKHFGTIRRASTAGQA